MNEGFGPWRAAGNVHIYRNYMICTFYYAVGIIKKGPPLMAQAPIATTYLGSAI